jgi:hypothetical protein
MMGETEEMQEHSLAAVEAAEVEAGQVSLVAVPIGWWRVAAPAEAGAMKEPQTMWPHPVAEACPTAIPEVQVAEMAHPSVAMAAAEVAVAAGILEEMANLTSPAEAAPAVEEIMLRQDWYTPSGMEIRGVLMAMVERGARPYPHPLPQPFPMPRILVAEAREEPYKRVIPEAEEK